MTVIFYGALLILQMFDKVPYLLQVVEILTQMLPSSHISHCIDYEIKKGKIGYSRLLTSSCI